MRDVIARTTVNHTYIKRHAEILKLPGSPRDSSDILSVTFLINRLASLKLEPERHANIDDSILGLLRLGTKASFRRFDLPVRTRLLYTVWFLAAGLSPKRVTRWLVTMAFDPEHRGVLNKLV
jgi:hypothetical protein